MAARKARVASQKPAGRPGKVEPPPNREPGEPLAEAEAEDAPVRAGGPGRTPVRARVVAQDLAGARGPAGARRAK
jgi:hypothetical protein